MSRTYQQNLALYQETLKQRQVEEQQQLAQRLKRAWKVAEQAACFLKQEFKAERVEDRTLAEIGMSNYAAMLENEDRL